MNKYFIALSIFSILLISTNTVSAQQIASSLSINIVKETNQFRKSKGLPALISRNELNVLAKNHSVNMAKKRVGFGHAGFKERSVKAKQTLKGMTGNFAENVAYGPTSAKEVVKGWENSPGHRKNMLGNYKYIGIGIAADKNGRLYYTQIFAR